MSQPQLVLVKQVREGWRKGAEIKSRSSHSTFETQL